MAQLCMHMYVSCCLSHSLTTDHGARKVPRLRRPRSKVERARRRAQQRTARVGKRVVALRGAHAHARWVSTARVVLPLPRLLMPRPPLPLPLMPRLLDISWVPSSIRNALDPRMCVKHTRERSEVAHRTRKAASSVLGNGLQTVGAIGSVRAANAEKGAAAPRKAAGELGGRGARSAELSHLRAAVPNCASDTRADRERRRARTPR